MAKINALTDSVPSNLQSHPAVLLGSLASQLGNEFIEQNLSEAVSALATKRPYDSAVVNLAMSLSTCRQPYLDELLSRAGSSSFPKANECADKIEGIDVILAEHLTDPGALKLLASIVRAAK